MRSFNKLANLHRVFFKRAEDAAPIKKFKNNEEMMSASRGSDAAAGSLVRPPGSNFDPKSYLSPSATLGVTANTLAKANRPNPDSQRVPVSAHPAIPNPLRPTGPASKQLLGNELAQQHTMKATGRFGGPSSPENNGYNTGKGINAQGTSFFGENPTHGFGDGAGETLRPRVAPFSR